jgi:hypothetical protein
MTVSPPKLYAIVQRGQNRGTRFTPHRYADGKYHVARKKEATLSKWISTKSNPILDEVTAYERATN